MRQVNRSRGIAGKHPTQSLGGRDDLNPFYG
jgi:hypothetical protein